MLALKPHAWRKSAVNIYVAYTAELNINAIAFQLIIK